MSCRAVLVLAVIGCQGSDEPTAKDTDSGTADTDTPTADTGTPGPTADTADTGPPTPTADTGTPPEAPVWVSISAGSQATCGIRSTGAAWCWGLLPGGAGTSTTPVQVAGKVAFASLAVGDDHVCGIDLKGAAWCWGDNTWGQLGDGTYTTRPDPTAVSGKLTFRSLDVPVPVGIVGAHACGVTTTDEAWCWGEGSGGQLGIGADLSGLEACAKGYLCSTAPVAVTGNIEVGQVAAGSRRGWAIDAAGAVWAWGNSVLTPALDKARPPLASVDGLMEHACGVSSIGVGHCWGSSVAGKLGTKSGGDGDVAGGHVFAAISPGVQHTCGVTTSDEALCWGSNIDGALGRGDLGPKSAPLPTPVVGKHAFSAVSAGSHSCAVTPTGEAWCWGPNNVGQLGDGTQTTSGTPVPVVDPVD